MNTCGIVLLKSDCDTTLSLFGHRHNGRRSFSRHRSSTRFGTPNDTEHVNCRSWGQHRPGCSFCHRGILVVQPTMENPCHRGRRRHLPCRVPTVRLLHWVTLLERRRPAAAFHHQSRQTAKPSRRVAKERVRRRRGTDNHQ